MQHCIYCSDCVDSIVAIFIAGSLMCLACSSNMKRTYQSLTTYTERKLEIIIDLVEHLPPDKEKKMWLLSFTFHRLHSAQS